MKTSWFVVIESQGSWWVDVEGKAFGPLATREEASHYAQKLVEIVGDRTRQCEVWVPDEDGKPTLAWFLPPEAEEVSHAEPPPSAEPP